MQCPFHYDCPNKGLLCKDGQLFVSYRHRPEDTEFVEWLFSALDRETSRHPAEGERSEYHVWYDIAIQGGRQWEMCVEHAIDISSMVAAVMTPEFCERDPQNVCRKEIMYAFNRNKTIVPLRVSKSSKARHLLLSNLSWIDFTSDRGQVELDAAITWKAVERLADVMTGRLSLPRGPAATVSAARPLLFGSEMSFHLREFTGRDWLSREVDDWLTTTDYRFLVISAKPGVGKTAIAASLTDREDVVGIHLCSTRDETRDPRSFVASLAGQLSEQLGGAFRKQFEENRPAVIRKTPDDLFHDLLEEPLRKIGAPATSKLVVIDALDVAWLGGGQDLVTTLAGRAKYLPPWLRIVVTTRDEIEVLNRLKPHRLLEIDPSDERHLADVRRFVSERLETQPLADLLGDTSEEVLKKVTDLAEGNFLFASEVIKAISGGDLAVADLQALAPGIESFFLESFSRNWDLRGVGKARFRAITKRRYRAEYGALFEMLVAARGPLTLEWLCEATGRTENEINDCLNDMGAYLRQSVQCEADRQEPGYELFSRSLRDWLIDRKAAAAYWCNETRGHKKIAVALAKRREYGDYAVDNLLLHQLRAGLWDEAGDLLRDGGYLRKRQSPERQHRLESEFRELLRTAPIERLGRLLDRLLEGVLSSEAEKASREHGDLEDERERLKRQADWLDTFAYWLNSTKVGNEKRKRILRQAGRRFDGRCAETARRAARLYLRAGEQDWALRFAELRAWVCQRAADYRQCVEACKAAESLCRGKEIRPGYRTLGRCEFLRLRGLAFSELARERKLKAAFWRWRARDSYRRLARLFNDRAEGARPDSEVDWSLFERDFEEERIEMPDTESARLPGGGERFCATVVSNEHDCVSALHVIRYLESRGGRVLWKHHKDFQETELAPRGNLLTVLIGGPKSPALSRVAEKFYRADREAYLRMYSGLHCESSVLETTEGKVRCYMLGGISKVNTLMAAWEFTAQLEESGLLLATG